MRIMLNNFSTTKNYKGVLHIWMLYIIIHHHIQLVCLKWRGKKSVNEIFHTARIWILKMLKNKIEEKKMKKRCVKRSNQWKKLFIHFYPWKKQPNQVSRIFFSKFLFSLFSFQFEFLSLETQKRTRLSYTSLFIVVVVVHSSASWILSMFFVWCLSVMSIWWFFLQKKMKGAMLQVVSHDWPPSPPTHTIIINISQPNQTKPNTRYRTTTQKYLVENCTFSLFFWFGYFNSDWLAD